MSCLCVSSGVRLILNLVADLRSSAEHQPRQPLVTDTALGYPLCPTSRHGRASAGQNWTEPSTPLAVLGERKRVERTNTHRLMLFLSCRTAIIVDLIRLVCVMDVSKAIMKGSRYLPFLSGGSVHKLRQLWDTQES